MRTNEIKVFLKIHDFNCDPEEITKQLLVNPTNSWKKGDIIVGRNKEIRHMQSTWELQSNISETSSVEDHVESLISRAEINFLGFKKVIAKYTGELVVVLYLYDEFNPGIHFSKKTIEKIADLGLEVDFDIYFLKT